VRCDDINSYIRAAAEGDYSAKDFRTWSATVLAVVELARLSQPMPVSATARTRAVRQAVKVVAGHLGNTPGVCRNSYIDPRALDRFYDGESILAAIADLGPDPDVGSRSVRERIESAVVSLVADDSRTAADAAA
jgi:DNA topoisomerase IB